MDLDLKQKIGQKMLVGWQTSNADDICESIKEYNFGNVILFTRNIESASQLADLCGKIRETALEYNGVAPFIALDQEGGNVRRIYDGVVNVPGAMALAAASKKYPDSAHTAGLMIASDLKRLGINLNLAPVVDINTNPYNPVIAIRSYGDNPKAVSRLAAEFAAAHRQCGVLSCYKHFLGHGDVDVDSHLELPKMRKTLEELESCELIPYRDGDPEAIMSVHILYTALDDKLPVSLSKNVLYELLRKKMGFDGLIVTDCFEMDGLLRTFNIEEAAVFATQATTDLITISHSFGMLLKVRSALLAAVRDGVIEPSVIDDSVERILRMKEKYCRDERAALDSVQLAERQQRADELSRAAVTILSGTPFPIDDDTVAIGVTNFISTIAEDVNVEQMDIAAEIGREFGIPNRSIDSKNFNLNEILEFIGTKKVVLCLTDSHLTLVQRALFCAVAQHGNRILLVSMRTPYDIIKQSKPECHICTFEYTRQSCKSLLEVLKGGEAYGVCPVVADRFDKTPSEDNSFLASGIVDYIRVHYGEKLTLERVADEFMVSPQYVCRVLKGKTGKSFVALLTDVRMEEAKRLLVTTHLKVYEIATLCGFTESEYFANVFRRYVGSSPKYYRNNYQVNDL